MDIHFSHIHFPGIPKKQKTNLRAMKKPVVPPAPPSFLSKFRNPLKKEENPEPKQIILKDTPHKYNPVTKQYEFGDEKPEKQEEFQPPPPSFSNKEVTGAGKKYVDVIGQDVNLSTYKPGIPDQDSVEEKLVKEENKQEKVAKPVNKVEKVDEEEKKEEKIDFGESVLMEMGVKEEFPSIQEEATEKKVKKLEDLIGIEKTFREHAYKDLEMISKCEEVFEKPTGIDGFKEILELEHEVVELNSSLLKKVHETIELNEKLLHSELQVRDLKHQMEVLFDEKSEIIGKYQQDLARLEQELSLARIKTIDINQEANKTKELEKVIEHLQLRINFDTKARVSSEINEKKLILTVKKLENDFSLAANTIKALITKNNQLLQENQKLAAGMVSNPVSSSELFEIFKLTKENLSYKSQLDELDSQVAGLKLREGELSQKLKGRTCEVSQLEHTKNALQKKIAKDVMVLGWYQFKLNSSNSKNSVLAQNLSKLKASFQEVCAELESVKHLNEVMSVKNKNLMVENEKKLQDLNKKCQNTELKLRNQVQDSEESLKTLEIQVKAANSKVVEMKEALNKAEQVFDKELSAIKLQLLQETEEKNSLNEELNITKDSLNAELESLARKLEQQKFVTGQLEQEISENLGIREENKKIHKELGEAKEKIRDLEKEKGEIDLKCGSLSEQIEDLESEKLSLSNLLAQSSDETFVLQEKIKELEKLNEKLAGERENTEKELESLQQTSVISKEQSEKALQALETTCEDLKTQLKSSQIDLESGITKIKELEALNTVLENDKSSLINSIEALEQALNSEQSASKHLASELSSLKQVLESLEKEKTDTISYYEEELSKLESTKNELSEENIRMYEDMTKLEVDLRLARQEAEEIREKDKTKELEQQLIDKNNEVNSLHQKIKNEDQKATVLALQAQVKNLESALENEKSLKKQVESQVRAIESSNSLLSSQVNSLLDEKSLMTQELEEARREKIQLELIVSELEQAKVDEQKPIGLISELFSDQPEQVFLADSGSPLLSSMQGEMFELECRVKGLEDEKLSLNSQISDLSAENDALYEKNLSLASQIQFLHQELKKNSESSSVSELTQKLKDKEDELQLVKNSFHDLLVQNTEKLLPPQSKPSHSAPSQEGWFTSVLGSIFLTDKERGN